MITPPNVLDRLAAAQPATPFRLYHLTSATNAFISSDTQRGNNIVEMRDEDYKDSVSEFIIQVDTVNSGYKIVSNCAEYKDQGLVVSNDIMTSNIVETNTNCKGFTLTRVPGASRVVWIYNAEDMLYLQADAETNIVKLSDYNTANHPAERLFELVVAADKSFSIQHVASKKYLSLDSSDNVVLGTTPNSFKKSGVNPYFIQDKVSEKFLYVVSDTLQLKAAATIPDNAPGHFSIEEPDNLYQIMDPATNAYLYVSSDTQSGNNILEAKPIDQFTSVIDSYFTLKVNFDFSILVSCANASAHDIDVFTDFVNVQKWANDNNFFIYASLLNNLVPVPPSNPCPQSIVFDAKADFRKFITTFIQNSLTNKIIIYYSGHGSQNWVDVTPDEKNVEHYLCILGGGSANWYSDQDLTQDLNDSLAFGKKVYLIFDSCHAGGAVNPWQLENRFEHDVIGFFAANAEISVPAGPAGLGSPYTNAFLRYIDMEMRHYQLAEKILDKMYRSGLWSSVPPIPISPTTMYSRPTLCMEKFSD